MAQQGLYGAAYNCVLITDSKLTTTKKEKYILTAYW